ncbi:MAG: hypothetical protein IT233_03775 [Bacteroidia bacterium]|nr:hypothetical protein [Bacteroidia bacterium]
MKKAVLTCITAYTLLILTSCFKEPNKVPGGDRPAGWFESVDEFCDHVKPRPYIFSVNNQNGGSFTTPKGTVVTIPSNVFVTQTNGPVTGDVLVEFLDVFKKSDMLLLDMGTEWANGGALESTGEFFVRATQNNVPVILNGVNPIQVELPAFNNPIDTGMTAFDAAPDTTGQNLVWWNSGQNSLVATQSSYIFYLYQFSSPASNGTMCNSDQPCFQNVPMATLTMVPTNSPAEFGTEVFLCFTGVNAMVHVYGAQNFPYSFAPVGYQATLIAIGAKDGKLYSSFTPLTITNNMTVNFTLTETTETAFKAAIDALN